MVVTTVDEAIDAIEEAFADVPRPPDAEIADDDMGLLDRLQQFSDWRDIPDDFWLESQSPFVFTTPAVFRWILPWFMRAVLRTRGTELEFEVDEDFVIEALAEPSFFAVWRDVYLERHAALSAEEGAAVVAFIEALESRLDEVDEAVREKNVASYWQANIERAV